MKRLVMAGAVLFALALPATTASALTWNFGEHGFGALPTVQQFDTGGFFLTARGFGQNITEGDVTRALFSKNGGVNEVGLGFDGVVDNEISGKNFIQLDVSGIRLQLTNFQFSMDSVDNSEGWAVFGSMNATPFQFTQLAHSSGVLDNGVHALADGWDNYNFFFAPSGFGGPTGDNDVLLHSFSANLQAVPLPLAGAGIPGLLGLVGLVALSWRRRVRFAG